MSIIKTYFEYICNHCYNNNYYALNLSIFPDKLKIAKVICVFKADNPCLIQNYRPVSILPAFSKIFERVGNNHISKYLTENMILSNNQLGFESKTPPSMP